MYDMSASNPARRRDVVVSVVANKLVAHIRTEWLKLTPEALADALEVPVDVVTSVEAGGPAVADVAFMLRLSRATGISLARIYAGVQVIESWLHTNYASAVDMCFNMSDVTRSVRRLHTLIETGIREMPETLRVSFIAPLKVTPVGAATTPPPVQASSPTLVRGPAVIILPARMPKLTPTTDDYDADYDDNYEPLPEPSPDVAPPTPAPRPAAATFFDIPAVAVLDAGVKRRPGRPRKHPQPSRV